jgi:hypothetical protein
MNTKTIKDTAERKKVKRAARKKAEEKAPLAKRASTVARGSQKKKVKKIVKGQRKR